MKISENVFKMCNYLANIVITFANFYRTWTNLRACWFEVGTIFPWFSSASNCNYFEKGIKSKFFLKFCVFLIYLLTCATDAISSSTSSWISSPFAFTFFSCIASTIFVWNPRTWSIGKPKSNLKTAVYICIYL